MIGVIIVKGLSLLVSLASMPVYMRYFKNNVVLGVWFSIFSVLNWILTFDLGIGNGLRNKLVDALARKDDLQAKRIITSAYIIIGAVSLLLILLFNSLMLLFDWNSIFNVKKEIIRPEALRMALRILFIGIMVQFFLKLIVSVMLAMQLTALSSILSLVSQSMIIFLLFILKSSDPVSSLIKASYINSIAINLPLIIASVYIFWAPLRKIRPNPRYFRKEHAFDVMKLGYLFFWVQIALLVINAMNPFLIGKLFSPEYVVEYQVYTRIFSLFPAFFSIITTPIWSYVANENSLNNVVRIRKIYWIINGLAGVFSAINFLFIFLIKYIVYIWLKEDALIVDLNYCLLFAIQNAVIIFMFAMTSIANGISELKTQVVCNTIAAIIKIPLTVLMVSIYHDWISVIIISIVIMIPCIITQPIALHRKFKEYNLIRTAQTA
jgi:O-antigen/teichoic acid export membrane protein